MDVTEKYQPPFHMTEEITNLIVGIGEYVGAITTWEALHQNPILRRENRIKTIHSSLAIEQNTLSLEQVSAVIAGKRVLGPPQEIQEVKNAYDAYERVSGLNPFSVKDLLYAHKLMMEGLVKEAGIFRSSNVGVYAGEKLIHTGTPARYVPDLMQQLLTWLKESKYHPLVKSCIFHYEFEFIHPFADGNGRIGRLWQSLKAFLCPDALKYPSFDLDETTCIGPIGGSTRMSLSAIMSIPEPGTRQSGNLETVVPAFWKPAFRRIGNRCPAGYCSGCCAEKRPRQFIRSGSYPTRTPRAWTGSSLGRRG